MESRNVQELTICQAQPQHLDELRRIFTYAKAFMSAHGNPTQWSGSYPSDEVVMADILAQECFLCIDEQGDACGCFSLKKGEEPTYAYIEGAWGDDSPYLTIHRLASNGKRHGVADAAIRYAKRQGEQIRIDTHQDNLTMRHILNKHGFIFCGTIYVRDGSARFAYRVSQDCKKNQ